MFIWRNLDPKILAQLLIQASVIWKARNAAARARREGPSGDAAAPQPSARGRGRREGADHV